MMKNEASLAVKCSIDVLLQLKSPNPNHVYIVIDKLLALKSTLRAVEGEMEFPHGQNVVLGVGDINGSGKGAVAADKKSKDQHGEARNHIYSKVTKNGHQRLIIAVKKQEVEVSKLMDNGSDECSTRARS
ncbi:hypothetical protein BT96DRAFT_947709 [Gymnopus androsaceus JB14]|uniref:Uncharacterized protein n=1 Tax=Gymnopus androsaceus JB14 TaxID=1447944 RepID=A0A6A4GR86_9AGAR|nr:hypothetical protein BT96DRAFT_947709 [Gymnopus androsaceus JB14]